MKTLLGSLLALVLVSNALGATTRNNDDSCDIAVAPAATLLLPYFEVNLDDPHGVTTIFTVTNVSPDNRIARVTLWSDLAYPAITFNLSLVGYAVQSIDLYEVIGRGVLPASCGQSPAQLPDDILASLRRLFLQGKTSDCNEAGIEHDHAVGYATIDLVRNCETNSPMTHEYWAGDLAWDNVLIGDYEQIDSAQNFATGSPLVHIRAIPEGGTLTERLTLQSPFPRTFYARYQPATAPGLDGRQPLPSVFAARWISGGPVAFDTELKIWREGTTGRNATCAAYDDNWMTIREIVLFDESENAFVYEQNCRMLCTEEPRLLPATSLTSVAYSPYPQPDNDAVAGWIYLNLTPETAAKATSNWVVSTMRAEGRYSVELAAAPLGNGCSPPADISEIGDGRAVIGPLP
jgi:hypothetical protein